MPTLQRLRLMPLYGSIWAADRLGDRFPATPRSGFGPWQPGISVVIPERDAPEMLLEALDSLHGALAEIDEPHQVVVVVNGAAPERYVGVLERYPDIEFVYRAEPLGFSAAIVEGLNRVRHDWTFLLNNDVTLDRLALRELAKSRGENVFAIASQIMQRSASGRREETGFVDWYVDGIGVRVFHADPGAETAVRPHLCASGGATLFRTEPLKRYARDSRCYDPFYWEDVEWGVRAWQDGMRVLFCPLSRAWHKHRVTTTRFYALDEIERMVERNRVLFDARNAIVREGPAWVVARIRELPEASQRELGRLAQAWAIFRQRLRARRLRRLPAPPPLPALAKRQPAAKMPAEAFAYRLRTADPPAVPPRPRVLVVAPFAIYPPRHGGARRIAGLLRELRRDFDIILVADEASIYDVRCMVHFDGLHAVHFVRTEHRRAGSQSTFSERLRTHCHPALVASVEEALQLYHPDIVQIEHVEIAELIHCRRPGQRWTLALHDACDENDFADRAEADWFQGQLLARYDAVTVCSAEDQAMVIHPRVVCVPNAGSCSPDPYRPSDSSQLLFMGPFRYGQNFDGIRQFLNTAYPAIRSAVESTRLLVLGGDAATQIAAEHREFSQPGVEVLDHREDVPELLDRSALTINPLIAIRGSALKLIESLSAGRVCVSTCDGARGFAAPDFAGLVTVPRIEQMSEPIVRLLENSDHRHELEKPDPVKLGPYQWSAAAAIQRSLYRGLLGFAG